jgi:acetate---CoA ligase (ADP-forming)
MRERQQLDESIGWGESDKPLIAYVSPSAPDILRDLNLKGIPSYSDPETCASALIAARQGSGRSPAEPVPAALIDTGGLPSGTLNEASSRELFERFGLTGAEQRVVHCAAEAVEAARELGGQVVLKVLSSEIAHKSDIGGVRTSLDQTSIADALERMARDIEAQQLPTPQGYLVQKMLKGGIEMIQQRRERDEVRLHGDADLHPRLLDDLRDRFEDSIGWLFSA